MSDSKTPKNKEDEPPYTLKQVKALLTRQKLNDEFIFKLKEYTDKEADKMTDPGDAIRIMTNVSAMVVVFISMNTIMTIAARPSKGKIGSADVNRDS